MKNLKLTLLALAMLCLSISANAQNNYTQNIRGLVIDKDIQMPLIGATVLVNTTDPTMGSTTDADGNFRIENIPIGRHDLVVQYLGYEPVIMNSILLKSGKELVLTIEMTESAAQLEEVVVSAETTFDKAKPLNEMATVSARSFSVEETSRYASSMFDPARMATNYAGVSTGAGGEGDLFNEIVIRGNSPAGVLWRLEGIQIPNPNHFGQMGASGGAISMLSSSTLSNSDFYTGAFPTEFGNALSGVFDLKMRNGNNEKREYSLMVGALGIELAAEGPFSKQSKASYLINYRYSTLAALSKVGLNPVGDILPTYQDISFNVNVPTANAGVFKLFGLGGANIASFTPEADSTKWDTEFGKFGFEESQNMGVVGLSHRYLLSNNSYLRTVAVASYEENLDDEYYLDVTKNYEKIQEYKDQPITKSFRVNSTYHKKIDARNTIQIGGEASFQEFSLFIDILDEETNVLKRAFNNTGSTGLLQGFAHWKHRFNNELTLNTGLHYTHLTLNNKGAIEPRAALAWQLNAKQTISAAVGLHSKQEHIGVYTFEGTTPNGRVINKKDNLGLTKAFHGVLGYDHVFNAKIRLKAEVYYQHLYDIPVPTDKTSNESLLNASDIWDIIGIESADNSGTGRNVGVDLTLEKFFTDNYYFLVTGSLYDSKYTAPDGKTYNTRFNGNYQLNTLGGKEWKVGKAKKNIIGLNGKFTLSGGARYTPADLPASIAAGYEIEDELKNNEARSSTYYRFDVGFSYKINRKNKTHSILLDIQNVTNRQNVAFEYFDNDSLQIEQVTQTGLFPNFNYRLEF